MPPISRQQKLKQETKQVLLFDLVLIIPNEEVGREVEEIFGMLEVKFWDLAAAVIPDPK